MQTDWTTIVLEFLYQQKILLQVYCLSPLAQTNAFSRKKWQLAYSVPKCRNKICLNKIQTCLNKVHLQLIRYNLNK